MAGKWSRRVQLPEAGARARYQRHDHWHGSAYRRAARGHPLMQRAMRPGRRLSLSGPPSDPQACARLYLP
jgi:hypothetical protein